ncbi:hypothetical protein [Cardinium endosymbiont of Culicoides punctatus]|uniref:hypothetical protein n=1 Tax=Cardinium endosymbiont of Culicoides punctatus TaxID=2304601 RepID=UPI0010589405|nr:hypothetical protein [Cardinium endosymbiont of Culicoides punctatus]
MRNNKNIATHMVSALALGSILNICACSGNSGNTENNSTSGSGNNIAQSSGNTKNNSTSGNSNNIAQSKGNFLFFLGHESENTLNLSGNEKSFTIKTPCTSEQESEYLKYRLAIRKTVGTCTIRSGFISAGEGITEDLIFKVNGKTVLNQIKEGKTYEIEPLSSEVEYIISITDKEDKTIGEPLKVIWK